MGGGGLVVVFSAHRADHVLSNLDRIESSGDFPASLSLHASDRKPLNLEHINLRGNFVASLVLHIAGRNPFNLDRDVSQGVLEPLSFPKCQTAIRRIGLYWLLGRFRSLFPASPIGPHSVES